MNSDYLCWLVYLVLFYFSTLLFFFLLDDQISWRLTRTVVLNSLPYTFYSILFILLLGILFTLPGEGAQVLYVLGIMVGNAIGQIVGYIKYRKTKDSPESKPILFIKIPILEHVYEFTLSFLKYILLVYFCFVGLVLGFNIKLLERMQGREIFSIIIALALLLSIVSTYRTRIKENK